MCLQMFSIHLFADFGAQVDEQGVSLLWLTMSMLWVKDEPGIRFLPASPKSRRRDSIGSGASIIGDGNIRLPVRGPGRDGT